MWRSDIKSMVFPRDRENDCAILRCNSAGAHTNSQSFLTNNHRRVAGTRGQGKRLAQQYKRCLQRWAIKRHALNVHTSSDTKLRRALHNAGRYSIQTCKPTETTTHLCRVFIPRNTATAYAYLHVYVHEYSACGSSRCHSRRAWSGSEIRRA